MKKPRTITKTQLKKELSSLSRNELEELLLFLRDVPSAAAVLSDRFLPDYAGKLLDYYEEKVIAAFNPANPERYSTEAATAIVSEFEGITESSNKESPARLKLTFIEEALGFINRYGYDENKLFNTITRYFKSVTEYASIDRGFFDDNYERIEEIVHRANIGYGLGSSMKEQWESA